MNLLEDVEERAVAAVRGLFADAKAHTPALEALVADGLHEAGAPPEVASVFGEAIKVLLDHFSADNAQMPPDTPDPAPEPQPEPVPGA